MDYTALAKDCGFTLDENEGGLFYVCEEYEITKFADKILLLNAVRLDRLERRDEFHQMLLRALLRSHGGTMKVNRKYETSLKEFNDAFAEDKRSEAEAA